ncbi:MAG TPA: hypothetical protein VK646_12635 [Actinomycetota bacterium]|nr:hypothetical protein [Actinomycetota bacterium]
MNGSHDVPPPSPAAGDDDPFDPSEAADLLVSTRRKARRSFEQTTPLGYLFAAVVVGAAYGALWLSVRHQDPYVGPSLAVIGWVYGIVVVSGVVSTTAYRRATRGVRGPSRREDAIRGLAIGIPWIAVFVFDGALKANGFGPALVYGVFDAAAPWLVVGAAFAALSAGRERWGEMAQGVTVLVIGTIAAFFGPSGVWGVLAVASFVGLVVIGVSRYVKLRRV